MNRYFVILLVLLLLTGCGGARWQNVQTYEQPTYTVRVQHLVTERQAQPLSYQHPVEVDVAVVADMLGRLTYSSKGVLVSSAGQVFHELEIEQLAPALARSLATVDQNQRIFFSSFFREPGSALRERRTDGVVFVDHQSRLNVAFSNIRLLPDIDNMNPRSMDGIDEPLRVTDPMVSLTVDGEYWRHQAQADGQPYPLWVNTDLTMLYEAALSVQPVGDDANMVELHRQRTRSGLEFLRELHKNGLINDQEYEERRRALLDTLQ